MAYGSLGPSHHATEDIAIMRAMPNMLVVAPGDPAEARLATQALIDYQGPAYLRIGRAGEPDVHRAEPEFQLGRAITVCPGSDIALISTGGMLHNAVQAAGALAEVGIHARVLSMHTVKPLDEEAILAAARETQAVFTLEEHSIIGGLGGAVAELLLESGIRPPTFKRIGLNGSFSAVVGTQEYLRARYGLDAPGIVSTVRNTLDH